MIERGLRAARILENEDLMSFFDEQKDLIKEALFNTTPDMGAKRDNLFYQHLGVEHFLQSLAAYKDAAAAILEAATAVSKEDD